MRRMLPGSSKGRYRMGAGVAFAVAVLAGLFVLAGDAFAHHPAIEGWASCDDHGHFVEFTSESWSQSTKGGGGNPHIDIAYALKAPDGTVGAWTDVPWTSSYRYDEDNDFQFDGDFQIMQLHPDGTEVQLRAQAGAPWSNGTVSTSPQYSDWIELPTDCTCNDDTTTTTKHHHPTTTTTSPTTTSTTAPTTTTVPTTTTTTAPTTTTTAPTTTTTAPTTTSTTTTAPTTTTSTTTTTTTTTAPTTTTTTTAPTTTTLATTTSIQAIASAQELPTTTTSGPNTAVLGATETRAAVLPATGSNTLGLAIMGGAMLVAGLFLVRAARTSER